MPVVIAPALALATCAPNSVIAFFGSRYCSNKVRESGTIAVQDKGMARLYRGIADLGTTDPCTRLEKPEKILLVRFLLRQFGIEKGAESGTNVVRRLHPS